MYAIIQNGGKQYKVSEGDILLLDCLNLEPKSKVEVTEVLALFDNGDVKLGSPYVSGAKVELEVINEGRGKKLLLLKSVEEKIVKPKEVLEGILREFVLLKSQHKIAT